VSRYRGLRLLVFQVRPVLLDAPNDGSQAILIDLLRHFSGLGVEISVYCGRSAVTPGIYTLMPGVTVHPALPLDLENAETYWTTPPGLARALDSLRWAVARHDVVYVHDARLRYEFITAERPTTAALFDLVYGSTAAGALDFRRDRLVATSGYVRDCVREVFRPVRPLAASALHTVNSGFSTELFRPRDPGRMRSRLGLPEDGIAVLYPHRPESAKGLRDAMAAVKGLRTRLPAADYRRIRLLVPVWPDTASGPERAVAAARLAQELDIEEQLLPHPWIPRSDMPQYYSAGAATMCIGTFPEALGNVHIESMLCGTPAVMARVGAHRSTVPEELARKVDPGDTDAVADHLAEIIEAGERTGTEVRHHLATTFGMDRMLRGYERAVLDCHVGPPLPLAPLPEPMTGDTRLAIPPWAARLRRGYYHDYTGYEPDPQLATGLALVERGCTVGDLLAATGVGEADLHRWLDESLLVSDPVVCPRVGALEPAGPVP
jgi:glycosyltransferase involved in cell wall biosynthesis